MQNPNYRDTVSRNFTMRISVFKDFFIDQENSVQEQSITTGSDFTGLCDFSSSWLGGCCATLWCPCFGGFWADKAIHKYRTCVGYFIFAAAFLNLVFVIVALTTRNPIGPCSSFDGCITQHNFYLLACCVCSITAFIYFVLLAIQRCQFMSVQQLNNQYPNYENCCVSYMIALCCSTCSIGQIISAMSKPRRSTMQTV